MIGRGGSRGRELHAREWGSGGTVIALHPLALESSAFEGLGRVLEERGLRTLAVDLPGFGKTPAPGGPLTPAVLAEAVIELARGLDPPPTLLGISLGGRVALEAVLEAPGAFSSALVVSPYLPWKRMRWMLDSVRHFDPRHAEKLPVERLWPLLKWFADGVERLPYIRDDPITKAGVRMLYYASCPATRVSILSAARELALDPAFGPTGLWTRLGTLRVPTVFVWGERDRLVSYRFARHVREAAPSAGHAVLRCCGHAPYGIHGVCFARAVGLALEALETGQVSGPDSSVGRAQASIEAPCLAPG